jgi:hypothetical protein
MEDMVQLFVESEPTRVLRVAMIDEVNKRRDTAFRLTQQKDRARRLPIDHGHLLSGAQISDRLGAHLGGDPIRKSATGTAVIEAEDKAGALRRSAVYKRIDAKRPMQTEQTGWNSLDVREAGPPDQRAIGKHPEILVKVLKRDFHGFKFRL